MDQELLNIIITSVITLLSGVATWYINNKVKNEKVQRLLTLLNDSVGKQVMKAANSTVKTARASDNWDAVAKEAVHRDVVKAVANDLGDKALNEINRVMGSNPNSLISDAVEAMVPSAKALLASLGK